MNYINRKNNDPLISNTYCPFYDLFHGLLKELNIYITRKLFASCLFKLTRQNLCIGYMHLPHVGLFKYYTQPTV